MKPHAGLDRCGLPTSVWARLAAGLNADLSRRLRTADRPASLVEWGQYYLPRHFHRRPSAMHVWLAEQFDAMRFERGAKLNVVGPRGGAKSTVATLACALRAAVEGWEPYIWIVSDTRQQACRHLENLRLELTENQTLAEEYPLAAGRGELWRAGAIRLRNGVTIEAFGTGQRIRGRRAGPDRPTLILCDDLQNDGHTQSALQRQRSRDWFQSTLLKAGTRNTNIVNLATALHRDALALELHRTPGWNSRIFKAIERWPVQMSLWHQWEAIYCDPDPPAGPAAARAFFELHQQAMEDGAQLLWPEEEDLYTLMRMRVEGGRTAFEREKQGSPLNPAMCEWPEAYFDEQIWFDEWPASTQLKVVALDPSKGRDARRSDYSAYVALAVDPQGVLYVDAELARRATSEMVAAGVELCRQFRPHAFGVETNQFQDLLAAEFEAAFQAEGLVDLQPWCIDNRVNKQVRIRRLGPYLSARRLRFRAASPGAKLLVEQLQEFPAGDHDDGPDALEMAVRLAGDLLGRRATGDSLGDRLPIGAASI